jgi:hypothetical protein
MIVCYSYDIVSIGDFGWARLAFRICGVSQRICGWLPCACDERLMWDLVSC